MGLFFPSNSLSTSQVCLRCLTAADIDRRSHSPQPPGTMSSILLTKHLNIQKLHECALNIQKLPSRCDYFEKRRKHYEAAKFFITQSTVSHFILPDQSGLRGRSCRSWPRCREFLSNRTYRYRSYTQTDDTYCWPEYDAQPVVEGRKCWCPLRQRPISCNSNAPISASRNGTMRSFGW